MKIKKKILGFKSLFFKISSIYQHLAQINQGVFLNSSPKSAEETMRMISRKILSGAINLLSIVNICCTGDLAFNTFRQTDKLPNQSTQLTPKSSNSSSDFLDHGSTEASSDLQLSTEWAKSQKTFSSDNQKDTISLVHDCTSTYSDSCKELNKTSMNREQNETDRRITTPAVFNITIRTHENNSSLNLTENFSGNSHLSHILTTVSYFTIFVGFVVVTINIMVMVAFARNQELRQNNHYTLVMGLSFSDLLMGLSVLVIGFRFIFPNVFLPISLCIVKNLSMSSLISSIFQIFCISLNRFLVLSVNPWANYLFDGNRKYCVCIVGWTSIFITFSILTSPKGDQSICETADFGNILAVTRWIACSLLLFLLLMIVIFYFLAIFEVKKQYMNVSGIASSQIDAKKKKTVIKSMKLVGMILLALFILSGPLIFSVSYGNIPSLHVAAFTAASLNSFVNPFIYCSRIKSLQNEIKSFFCCSK